MNRLHRFLRGVSLLLLGWTVGSAHAETITATLTFANGDGRALPIRNATVEVWSNRPRVGPIWSWAADKTVTTDAQGKLSTTIPYPGVNAQYGLRVHATNDAVHVMAKDNLLQPFYAQPGPPGVGFQPNSTGPNSVLDFSWNFSDSDSRGAFNIADALQKGRAYALARRDPAETDTIDRVDVVLTSGNTYYDPVTHQLRFNPAFAMDDFTALHEYGHYLEEHISSFVGVASSHNGCTTMIGAVHAESPWLAWMEGFADYFSAAVGIASGREIDGPATGTISEAQLLNVNACANSGIPGNATEWNVAGALVDLIDPSNRSDDIYCLNQNFPIDKVIFQIFDHELDTGFNNPDMQQFVNAWIARGLELPPLLRILNARHLTIAVPPPIVNYGTTRATHQAVWRVTGGAGNWLVNGGANMSPPTFGAAGDIPVPADYDGDGITDYATWRPSDGTWRVLMSATGRVKTQQWGQSGDVPMPGDYDGIHKAQFAVYRPSSRTFFIFNDHCGGNRTITIPGTGAGKPVIGDFEGVGAVDPGVYDDATGFEIIKRNGTGLPHAMPAPYATATPAPPSTGIQRLAPTGLIGKQLIVSRAVIPVIGDYDADGRPDFAYWNPSDGVWTVHTSSHGNLAIRLGQHGDIPVPADYDGDGRTDFAVYRPSTGQWLMLLANGTQPVVQWGQSGDVPVAAP